MLYDLLEYMDEEIKGQVINRIVMTIMRDIQKRDIESLLKSTFKAAMYLRELEDHQTGIGYFEALMRYLFSTRADLTRDDFHESVKKIATVYPGESELAMTIAEMFREEGMEKGMEVGSKQGMELNLIAKLTGLPRQEVETLAKEIEHESAQAQADSFRCGDERVPNSRTDRI